MEGLPAEVFQSRAWWDGKRLVQLIACLSAVAGAAVALLAPVYSIVSESSSGIVVESTQTLVDVNGTCVIGLAIIPVVVAGFPLLLRGRSRVVGPIVAAVLLVAFVGLSAATIGMFFLVTAISAILVIFVPGRRVPV